MRTAPPRLLLLLGALLVLTGVPAPVGRCHAAAQAACQAFAPGDIILGINMPSHRKVTAIKERTEPNAFHCSGFDPKSFIKILSLIHEINRINDGGVLPGLRLGYRVYDTCSYASKALQNVVHMLALNISGDQTCDRSDFRPRVKMILGPLYSEESIAVTRLLNVYMVPLLSSTSSSPELSDKERYPAFLRTIPSDVHQTKAMAKIMRHYKWNWVGVVYGDDDYGRSALESFVRDSDASGVCLAYRESVPHNLDHANEQRIKEVARKIRSVEARVVLLILKDELVGMLFREMIRTETKRIWIASDSWSRSGSLAHMDGIDRVGDILGFTFIAAKSESFDGYLRNLTAPPGGYNRLIEEYKNLRFNCSECLSSDPPPYCPAPDGLRAKASNACAEPHPKQMNDDYLVTKLDTSETFMHRVAVRATANALKKLLKCNDTACAGDTDFAPWELLRELKEVKFRHENLDFQFDDHGDSVNGYDLIIWEKFGRQRRFRSIGRYNVLTQDTELFDENFTWDTTGNTTAPWSRCSNTCNAGFSKKILNVSCCYNCTACEAGTYSDNPDLSDCKRCPSGTYSLKGWARCQPRLLSFLGWADPHPIAVTAAAVFGILILLVTAAVFLTHRDSPAVLRAELKLSCVMKAGLAVSFAAVLCYMGRPSVHLCRARHVLYGLGFTLCVSCVLVKAYRTFLGFLPTNHRLRPGLHRLYNAPVIVGVATGLQGLICLLWMVLDSPDVDDRPPPPQSPERELHCTEGSTYWGFGVMLGYIAVLACVCFLLAFKGRQVPQENSETGYIIFSMFVFLLVWVCLVPLYITRNEEATIVLASAILVSNYGIIFCHFLPKCYQVFRPPCREPPADIVLANPRTGSMSRTRSMSL